MKGPQLFGQAHEINDTLFITHLYSNVGDTSRDINFLLKVADAIKDLEKNKITKNDIIDSNVKEFIEKLPQQKKQAK